MLMNQRCILSESYHLQRVCQDAEILGSVNIPWKSHFGPFGQRGVHTTRNPFDGVVQVFSRDGLSRRLEIRMSERKEAV